MRSPKREFWSYGGSSLSLGRCGEPRTGSSNVNSDSLGGVLHAVPTARCRLMHSQLCNLQSESFRSKGRLWIFLPLLEHAGSTGSEQGAPPGHSLHLCCRPCAGCPGPCAAGPGRIDTMTCPGLSGLASHALRCPPHILTVSVRCLPKHRWLPLVQARCRASCRNGGRFLHRSLHMEIVLLHRWRQLSTGFSFFLLVFFAYARAARLLSVHHAWHGWPLV